MINGNTTKATSKRYQFFFENMLSTCFIKWKLEVYKKAVQDGEVPVH
jgi:hypothetical protein